MDMELITARLTVREFVEADAPFIVTLLNQSSFLRFIGDKKVRTIEDARNYIQTGPLDDYKRHGFGQYLVQLKDANKPIGMCGLLKREKLEHADLGFAFLPEAWGNGYAFEAASAVLEHARDVLKLSCILAITNPDNDASIKLLSGLGFQFECLKRLSNDADQVKVFSLNLASRSADSLQHLTNARGGSSVSDSGGTHEP
jgi:ribosomal-protein-alanine N-acetyltransferase